MSSNRLFLLPLIALLGCKSDDASEFAAVADKMRANLIALQPAAETVLETIGADDGALTTVVEACKSADQPLEQLAQLKHLPASSREAQEVGLKASELLEDRSRYCNEKRPLAECARYCAVYWTSLVLSVEMLRTKAAARGVNVAPAIKRFESR